MRAWLSSSLTIVAIVLLCDAQVTYPRSFYLWSSLEIHSTILKWGEQYPAFFVVQTSQEAFGLPSAGKTNDCPFDGNNVGCLNYFGVIQDYVVNPIGSAASNQLPTVLLSGALHGNERVGPTAVMETASLLLAAAACESTSSQACRKDLTRQGIIPKQRRWLARLVRSRRIILVPTANALGYYRYTREEGDIDPNRDFPFDRDPSYCMRSIAARTLNELFLKYIIQLSLTYHAGIDMIGYEWGAFPYENNDISPDDVAQSELAAGFSKFAGGWVGQRNYPIGTINDLLYPVNGGMEDWAYAGSWDKSHVLGCQPRTFGGYATSKTLYNDANLRAFNILVETSLDKIPVTSLGTSRDILLQDTSGNGHVSRNVRVSLAAIDLVEPYVSIVAINDKAVTGDFAPLKKSSCKLLPSISIPKDAKELTIQWTVGGAISIDSTNIWIVDAKKVSDADLKNCTSQPEITTINKLFQMGKSFAGEGFFSINGPQPTHGSTIGPRFTSKVLLSSETDSFLVIASAKVDSSWATQPSKFEPDVKPQSHLANVRTNPSWKFSHSNQTIQGRLNWFSIPIRIKRLKVLRSPLPPTSSATVRSPFISYFPGNTEVIAGLALCTLNWLM